MPFILKIEYGKMKSRLIRLGEYYAQKRGIETRR